MQKVALELTRLDFVDIETVESLRRVLSVKKYDVPEFDFNMDMKKTVRKEGEANAEMNVVESSNTDGICGEEPAKNGESSETAKKRKHSKSDVNSYNEDDVMQFDDDKSDKPVSGGGGGKAGVYSCKAINIQPGHTGFLTFATLLHKEY